MMQLVQYLSAPLQAELRPMVERWQSFVPKLTARVDEVIAEANVGLDALIEQHATDFGPMTTAFGTLDARFRGLVDKIREGGDKLEETVWEVLFRDDLSPQDQQTLGQLHTAVTREANKLREDVEMRHEALQVDKSAVWARKLYDLARTELEKPVACTQCGAALTVTVFWQASNQTCAHCRAVNALTPGAATYAYFGQGVHALAQHASFAAWRSEQHQKAVLDAYRHPTAYDHWQWLEAARGYWTLYYQHYASMFPGFAGAHGSIEAAVAAKLKHYTQYDPPQEQQARDYLGQILEAARHGNLQAVRQMAGAAPQGIDIGDCAEAAMERHDTNAAALLLGVKHELDGEYDPRDRWVAEQLRELAETVRNR